MHAAFADSDKSNVKIYFLTVPKLDEYKFLVQSEEAVNTRLTVGKYSAVVSFDIDIAPFYEKNHLYLEKANHYRTLIIL